MTGYAQGSSGQGLVVGEPKVTGALRGPAGFLGMVSGRRRVELTVGVGVLVAILGCSLLLVVVAADRPSFLAATSTSHYFPHWMAGPLGGLWPSLTRSALALKYLFTAAIVVMYASYLLGLRYVPRVP